ncbi:phage tail tip fiber protein [Cedecea lapagei]|uniref:phage tail tip fiber protein n=1 Tax=Cedecea lapagei TaxID=158823 RepID=UPI001BCAEEBD|nr:DUF1983 domain-containing protein [Cedecea lapagei]
MGKGGLGGILTAVITAVVVAAATWATFGAAGAIAFGIGAGALSLYATSMLGQLGQTPYVDVSQQVGRSTSPATGLPILYGGQLPHKSSTDQNGSFILTGTICSWFNVFNGNSEFFFSEQAACMAGTEHYIEQIFMDNQPVLERPITQDGIVPREYLIEQYRNVLTLEVRFGGDYSTTKELASRYAGPEWKNNFYGKGVVSISTLIRQSKESIEKRILNNDRFTMSVEMKGQQIYDLNENRKFATSCPASQIFDYFTNEIYGMGIDPELLNLQAFREVAAYCKANKFYSNGAIAYQDTFKKNIESILSTFGGIIFVHAGQVYITVDRKTLSVASFDESNIVGKAQVSTSGTNEYYNAIDARYTNINTQYSDDVIRIPSVVSEDDVIRTDGRVIPLSREYTWIYDQETVAKIVNVELLKSKYSQNIVTFNTPEAWDLKVWDAINIKLDELGINGKYKILSKNIATDQQSIGYSTITALEFPDGIYDGVDPGVWSPGGVIGETPVTVMPPTNLRVSRKGNILSGFVVELNWDASPDPFLRGYRIYSRTSGSLNWTFRGQVSSEQTYYEIFGLSDLELMDFAVVAYNNLGLNSTYLSLSGVNVDYSFGLPSVTSLRLLNATDGSTITDSTDFQIGWDSQRALIVNGKPFNDYFKYYEVSIYDNAKLVKKFTTRENGFNFTFELNESRLRSPSIGVTAIGYDRGTYSEEKLITVQNLQHKAPKDLQIQGGYESLFINWNSNVEKDYAGTLVQISEVGTVNIQFFETASPQFISTMVRDGTYDVIVGHYDVFNKNNLNYSPAVRVAIKSQYDYTPEDIEQLTDLLKLDEKNKVILDEAQKYADEQMQEALKEANENTNTVVNQTKQEITTETNTKITALETTLSTQIVNNDRALNQRIDIVQAGVGENSSKITDLTKVVADNESTQATRISTLQSQFENIGGNIIKNSSFILGNGNDAQGWIIYNNAGVPTHSERVAGRQLGYGFRSVFDANSDSTHGILSFDNAPAFKTGKWYTISFYAYKTFGANFGGCFLAWNSTPTTTVTLANPNLNSEYQRYAFAVKWDEGNTPLSQVFFSRAGTTQAGDSITFADVMITEGYGVKGYVPTDDDGARSQIQTLESTVATEKSATAQRFTAVEARVGNAEGSIRTLDSTVVANNNAQTQRVDALSAKVDNDIASVNTKVDASVNNLTNTINASYSLSVNANGSVAGMKLIASNNPAINTAIYFTADKFVVSPSTGAATGRPPFAIDNGTVYLDSAMIRDASISGAKIVQASIDSARIQDGAITNAKIGNVITSYNWDGGYNGWAITKDGYGVFNNITVRGHIEASSGSFTGNVNANSGYFRGRIEATDGYFQGTVYADRIEGDIVKTYQCAVNSSVYIPPQPYNRALVVPFLGVSARITAGGTQVGVGTAWLTINGSEFMRTARNNNTGYFVGDSGFTTIPANVGATIVYNFENRSGTVDVQQRVIIQTYKL